jgi:anaerobic selenocysteine-containing dehydrogenase
VVDIRGDAQDPFSRGYICPKAYGLKELQEDPDRLTKPLRKRGRDFEEIGWSEAFAEAIERLSAIRTKHGADAIGTYLGNPTAHSLHAMVYGPVLQRAIGTKNRFSASSADQLPKMVSAGLMFGAGLTVPVPDLDRTSYLLVLGANPRVSNGSLMTAPDVGARLDGIIARGGRVVVVDPRRSETASKASEHISIRPGTDAAWLLAIVHVLFQEGLVRLGRLHTLVDHLEEVRTASLPFSPERVAAFTDIAPDSTRRIARAFAAADSAACYGRTGTTCQRFGSLASYAVDLVNILTGNLDRAGGAMFTRPAAQRGSNRRPDTLGGTGVRLGKRKSRVKQLPYMFGEFPVATLADEILTEGSGQIRAMFTFAGNPVSSAPGVERLAQAFASLEYMVSVDFYLNETTRFAHLILPPPAPLEKDTYDLALYQLAVRNVAKYSLPALDKPPGQPSEWEILATLAKGMLGMTQLDLKRADDLLLAQVVREEVGDGGRFEGLTPGEALDALGPTPGPERVLDLLLRTGPFGDGFGRHPGGLSLARLRAEPHGIDLGALQPELPGVLRTPDARIDLAPALLLEDLPRLLAALDAPPQELALIGRRQLRNNNSWMHNLPALAKGKARCTLLMHPADAARLELADGDRARVSSASGAFEAEVHVTDEMRVGVISLPHGFGHRVDGARLRVAYQQPGVNVNLASDPSFLDVPSGNAAFNGVAVQVTPVRV